MIIKSVTIRNFRSYRGEHTVNLDVDRTRPVILVYGKNGAGKTGFMNSILWCFYGSLFFGSTRTFAVRQVNKDVKKGKSFDMAVTVVFEHEGKKWVVKRSLEYVGSGSKENTMSYKGDQGGPIVSVSGDLQEDGYVAIESVLPMNAAHFHFFDGEQMRRYTREKNTEEVRKAIELVLNLPTLINSKTDLDKTLREIEDERSKIAAKNDRYTDLLAQRDEIEQGLEEVRDNIERHTIELNKVSEDLSIIEARLAEYDELKDKIDDLRALRTELSSLSDHLKSANNDFGIAIDRIPHVVLYEHVKKAVHSFKKKRREIEEGLRIAYSERVKYDAMVEMLEQGKACSYCGAQPDDEQREYLASEIERLGPAVRNQTEGKRVSSELLIMEERGSEALNDATSASTEITVLQAQIAELNNKIRAARQKSEETKKDLRGVNEELYVADRKNFDDLEIIKRKESDDLDDLVLQRNALESSKDEIESELDKHSVDDKEIQEISKEKTRAADSLEAVSQLIDAYVHEMKVQVEEGSSEILRLLTHKRETFDGVCVDENFAIDIVDKQGEMISRSDLSAGEQQVLALSFMGGLAKASGSRSPFLMDTPFGRLDKEHKQNILRMLPELSDQVVLFVTDDDLDQYEESILNRRISKIYEVIYDEKKRSSRIVLRT